MELKFPEGDTHFAPSAWQDYQLKQYTELVRLSPHRKLALDCGAHAGIMSRRMCRDYEHVIAFEPVHWELLESNTQDFANIKIIDCAVGETNTTSTISINPHNTGDNRVGSGSRQIQVIQIDSLDIHDVAAIKMDIQGSELTALLGARDTILHDHPTMMLEVEPDDPTREQIEDLMQDWGYRLASRRNADRIYTWRGWDRY